MKHNHNNTAKTSRRGAGASTVKGSASGSKEATQKGNKSSATVKVAASGSKASQKGNKTAASVKGAAIGSKAPKKSKRRCATNGVQHTKDSLNERVMLGAQMAIKCNLGRMLPHARGFGFKPRRGGFPSGSKKEWGLSPKAK
nr:hypothetical protein [Tanacetum cinerariifolium]